MFFFTLTPNMQYLTGITYWRKLILTHFYFSKFHAPVPIAQNKQLIAFRCDYIDKKVIILIFFLFRVFSFKSAKTDAI